MTERIALVTGAGSGIGAVTAAALLKDGWNTVLTGRRREALDDAIAKAGKNKGRALAVPCDVGKPDDVERLFATIDREFGRLDLLFNNAGMGAKGMPIDEIPVETWFDVVGVNLTGAFLCARAAFGRRRWAAASSTTGRSRPMRRVRARCPIRRPSMLSPD